MAKRVVIPEGTTEIADGQYKHSQIEELILPSTLKKIGKDAFAYSYELKRVTVPNSCTSIGARAFSDCTALEYLDLGTGVKTIGSYAFYYCNKLKEVTIPDSVTKIGNCAFSTCGGLIRKDNVEGIVSLKIGKGVTSMGNGAFYHNGGLTDVCIADGVTAIGDNAFWECLNLKRINIPESVTYIGKCAFCGCEDLTEIILPQGLTTIGDDAFRGCVGIDSIVIPECVNYIGREAFAYCSSLTNVTLPEKIDFIGSGAFRNCGANIERPAQTGSSGFEMNGTTLKTYSGKETDVVIPDGVEKIAGKAFFKNSKIKSITIPASVKTIATHAIESCAKLERITIDKGNKKYRMVGNCIIDIKKKSVILGFADSTIPADGSVTSIGGSAFSRCKTLSEIDIPSGVTSIGVGAFEKCANLKDVRLPQSLTDIGNSAFADCKKLVSIDIPENVTSIGAHAFDKCETIKTVTVPEKVAFIGEEAFARCAALTEINFNATMCADFVHSDTAFAGVGIAGEGITVNIGAGVSRIPNYLFYPYYGDSESIPNITNVVFADGSVCTRIGECAFEKCAELKSINVPDSVTAFECECFADCAKLESIHIPEGTKKIAPFAFKNCVSLKDVRIPSGVAELSYCTFERCGNLDGITVDEGNEKYCSLGNCLIERASKTLWRGCNTSVIPTDGSVTSLSNQAFAGCARLESINIPDGVTDVGYGVFDDCVSLKYVTVAKSVERFRRSFENCPNIEKITAPKKLLKECDDFGVKNRKVLFIRI